VSDLDIGTLSKTLSMLEFSVGLQAQRKGASIASNLPNIYPETNIIFSPDERYLLTGVAAKKGQKGDIVVLNREGLTESRRITVGQGTVVKVAWQSKINQVCD
jgi:hypothetical protein